jgi:uncharacterized protein YkwD
VKTWSTAVVVALLSSLALGTQAVEASPARTASGSRGNGSSYEVWRMNRDRNNDIFELRVWRNVPRQTSPPTCTYAFVSRSDALAFWDRIADQAGCPNQASVTAQTPATQTTQAQRPNPAATTRRRIAITTITTVPGETNRQPTATQPTATQPTQASQPMAQPTQPVARPSQPAPATTTTTATTTNPQPRPTGDIAGQILALVNAERQRAGVAPLRLNSQLNAAAQRHVQDMANNSNHSHTGTDGSSPGQRIAAVGYSASTWGENIQWGNSYTSAAAAMQRWMESPGHRQNILNPNYTELGVAFVVSESGRPYWVQKFGRPR